MPRNVLITGCSDGGLGAALAVAFHKNGDRVIATARNTAKMASLEAMGIDTLQLDVLSEDSIKAAVQATSKMTDNSLDVLVNNAGQGYSTPLMDASIPALSQLFELNTISVVRVTQLFFPLLRNARDGALLVNNTSCASVMPVPLQGPYSGTKAALASFSGVLRQELQPFNIKVVDLKTGMVKSNFFANASSSGDSAEGILRLPEDSLYLPGREKIEKFMRSDIDVPQMPADEWAAKVVQDLSKKSPPVHVWRGGNAFQMWLSSFLPVGMLDSTLKKMTGLDIVENSCRGSRAEKTK
ncbi:NADPH-dependent 1-acyldihydroxyacetone phosphate reductase [Fonsecaea pedrosoi]|nr:NADPH-dependent 1-acyldihydroxyacetone phosphate reductase [Fonsecaea pedrosoi]